MSGLEDPNQSFAGYDDGEACYEDGTAMHHAIDVRHTQHDLTAISQFSADMAGATTLNDVYGAMSRQGEAIEHNNDEAARLHFKVDADNAPPISFHPDGPMERQTSMSPISEADEERSREYTREWEETLARARGESNPLDEELQHTSPTEIVPEPPSIVFE